MMTKVRRLLLTLMGWSLIGGGLFIVYTDSADSDGTVSAVSALILLSLGVFVVVAGWNLADDSD